MTTTTEMTTTTLVRAAADTFRAVQPGDTRLDAALAASDALAAIDALVADLAAASLASTRSPTKMAAVRRAAAAHFAALAAQYATQAGSILPVPVDRTPGLYRPEPAPAVYEVWEAAAERAARAERHRLLGEAERSLAQARATAP